MSATSPATGAELKTFVEGLLNGETYDSDVFLALLNAEKDIVEGERNWEILKKIDSTQSASTAAKTLPTDFREPLGLTVGTVPYIQVPFEQQRQFANSANRWYLDMRNSVYYLLGSVTTGTIYFAYKYQSDDITTGAFTGGWPARFYKMLGYRLAAKFYDVDQEEKGLSYHGEWDMAAQAIMNSLIEWDAKLQKRAVENGLPFDVDGEVDLGLM